MNFLRGRSTVKNSIKEEYDIPKDLDLLDKWTIPKVEPKIIYRLGTFEKLGLKQVVKTTEESISLDNEEMEVKLLSENDIASYRRDYRFLHIGLIQVAFKPLTMEGLPESFIAALRDGRNLNWQNSLMGIIESSLAHGPVYFDVYPNLQLSLTDANLLDAVTLNVKTNGFTYRPGSELICICYRIYYKPLVTLNPMCRRADKNKNETVLIETNFSRSKIMCRRTIKWEEINFPENWTIERGISNPPQIQSNLINISQAPEGTVNLQFDNSRVFSHTRLLGSSSRHHRSRSLANRSYFAPDYPHRIDLPRSSTSQVPYHVDIPTSSQDRNSDNSIEDENKNLNPEDLVNKLNIRRDGLFEGGKDYETMSDASFKALNG